MVREVMFDVTWIRPLKLIGLANLLCGIITFIFSMSLEDWVISDQLQDFQYYSSLWKQCQSIPPAVGNKATIRAEQPIEWKCDSLTTRGGYVSVVQALIVIPFIISIIAFALGIVAYCKHDWRVLYKIAGIMLIVGAVLVLIAVIVFPAMFIQDLPFYTFFWFGWGYGVAWAALCFILTAGVLFLISLSKRKVYKDEKNLLR